MLLVLAAFPRAVLAQNYSDIWWDPSEGGWGLSLADHGTQLSGVLYAYGPNGRATWYLIPAGTFSQDKRFFSGDIYYTWGSPLTAPRNPNQASIFRYGSVTLDFMPPGLPPGTALFNITLSGINYTKTVQRFPFGNAPANWGSDYTDLWSSQTRSDWGIALAQHGDAVFGVWYSYGAYGSPDWYFFPGAALSGGSSFSVPLYFSGGPYVPSSPFDSSGATSSMVGNVTVDASHDQATLISTLNGATKQWTIAPLQFGDGPLAVFCAAPQIAAAPTVLTASPINPNAIRWITPLGNLNPPHHALPTDHIYFYIADPDERESPIDLRTEVVAPGAGTVSAIIRDLSGVPDTGIYVSVSADITYYLGHVIPDIQIAIGTVLQAGQHIGTTGTAYAMDLGVINRNVTQSFVNPSRYIDNTLHADGPLKYYGGVLQSLLYLKTHRLQPECDGKINYDIAGRLSGNWYTISGTTTLSFVGDTYDPTQIRLSVPFGMKPGVEGGVASVDPGDPQPSDISAASGPIVYTLTSARTNLPAVGAPLGYLLVQMLDDTHVKAEPFGINDYPRGFTAGALAFSR